MSNHEATVCWYWLMTSALSFAVQRIKHCPLGKKASTHTAINKNIGESIEFRMPRDKLKLK